DLGCDYYGASLHKWLMTPVGSGVLWMKPEHTAKIWPLFPNSDSGMKRFFQIGTAPEQVWAAALPALAFHESLGTSRKGARMRFLAKYWRSRVEPLPGVRFYTQPDPAMSCGMATFSIDNVNAETLSTHLWEKHRILVVPKTESSIVPEIRGHGVRVTPTV